MPAKKELKNLKEIQRYVERWIKEVGEPDWTRWNYFARLIEETGEVGEIISLSEGHKKHKSVHDHDLETEVGDIVFVLAALANSLEVDLIKCFSKVRKKHKKKFGDI